MSGFFIRLRLWLKLWFRSFYPLIMMALIPIVAYTFYVQQSYSAEGVQSLIYEKIAPIWFIFIVHWCFSIDFDSKFVKQIITYPLRRWAFIIERFLFSAIIFSGLLCITTAVFTPFYGSFIWKALLFSIPIYIGFAGVIIVGIIIGNHSLGGIFTGLLFWVFITSGGALLRDLNAILLIYQSVYTFVSGESGFFSIENYWIFYNRLFYFSLGVAFIIGTIFRFNRNSV